MTEWRITPEVAWLERDYDKWKVARNEDGEGTVSDGS